MGRHHDVEFPGESTEYREARDRLLDREIELRRNIEEIAALRRTLPPGGRLKEDYVFEEGAPDLTDSTTSNEVRLSDLFSCPTSNALIIYGFMYGPVRTTNHARCAPLCWTA